MVQALVEVTTLAEKGGYRPGRVPGVPGRHGAGRPTGCASARGDLVSRDWTPTFTTELLRKDFDLGLNAARSLEVPMPVGAERATS